MCSKHRYLYKSKWTWDTFLWTSDTLIVTAIWPFGHLDLGYFSVDLGYVTAKKVDLGIVLLLPDDIIKGFQNPFLKQSHRKAAISFLWKCLSHF